MKDLPGTATSVGSHGRSDRLDRLAVESRTTAPLDDRALEILNVGVSDGRACKGSSDFTIPKVHTRIHPMPFERTMPRLLRSNRPCRTRKPNRNRLRPTLAALEVRNLLTTGISALSTYQSFAVGVDRGPVQLATFTDSEPAFDGYSVSINWGDGTSSAGLIVADPNVSGQMDVTASHTYAAQGMNLVSVTIGNVDAGTTRTVSSIDPALIPTPVVTTTAPTGLSVGATVASVPVATFTDADPDLTSGSFSATVSWGDGLTSPATITADPDIPGQFDVTASKPGAYAHAGDLTFGVSVSVPGNSPSQGWVQLAGMPQALGSVVPTFDGGMVYQIGGTNGQSSQTVNAYDPSTNAWTQEASLPGQDQALASTLGPDGDIYVAAYDPVDSYTRMDIYDPTANTWTSSGAISVASSNFSMTTGPDGLIYMVGGVISGVATSDVFTYDPGTGDVSTVASLPTARLMWAPSRARTARSMPSAATPAAARLRRSMSLTRRRGPGLSSPT